MLVKITILVLVVTYIYTKLIEGYVQGNPLEAIRIKYNDNYHPTYLVIRGLLVLASIVLAIASIVYLLFFRG